MLWFSLTPQQLELAKMIDKFRNNVKKVILDYMECFYCAGEKFETFTAIMLDKVYKVTRCTTCHREKELEFITSLEDDLKNDIY